MNPKPAVSTSSSLDPVPAVGVKLDLSDLLARVEAAMGPDRELDFRLHIALVEDEVWPVMDRRGRVTNPNSRMSDYLAIYSDVIRSDDQDFTFGRYTASLDAALALVERALPKSWDCLTIERNERHSGFGAFLGPHDAFAKTPALALLAALLRALIATAGSADRQPSPRDAQND